MTTSITGLKAMEASSLTISALVTALALALAAGALGCFVIWRRMAYFGDGLAHSALLGVALGLLFDTGLMVGILLIALLFAIVLSWLQAQNLLAVDSLLGLLAHATLAAGLLTLALAGLGEADMHEILVGRLERVSPQQAIQAVFGVAVALGVLLFNWRGLIHVTVNRELAQTSGIAVRRYEFLLILLLALFVAIAVQLVGVLLVTSMLIIPAATARLIAHSPEAMGALAMAFASVGNVVGLVIANPLGVPVSPMIVVCQTLIFGACLVLRLARRV